MKNLNKKEIQKLVDELGLKYKIDNWAASFFRKEIKRGVVLSGKDVEAYYRENAIINRM